MENEKKAPRKKWGDPGSKVTRTTTASVFSAGKRRHIAVTVYANGIIGLRLVRHRTEEYIDVVTAYRKAVWARMALERAAKRKARKKAA